MHGHDADRNLLFGIVALQMDFITRDALITAMNSWALEKHRPIGEILVSRGAPGAAARHLLEPMVDLHVARHGGDPAGSLASLSSAGAAVSELRETVADAEVLASLGFVGTRRGPDVDETLPFVPGESPTAQVRYRKVREHARGGLGEVFVAVDEELGREVALKEIQGNHADVPASRARFVLEAEVTGSLEHPGIVPVYGLGRYDDGRPFYAMRFIKGDSLKDAIERFHRDAAGLKPGERKLELQKLLRRFLDVCNAISYAHSRGVLHRDLKPKNIMVGKYGETLVVDWGLAKAKGRADVVEPDLAEPTLRPSSASGVGETLPGSVVGTPQYMSPEQAAGRLDLLGPASDVYSLGATLYCLLTGKAPFRGDDLAAILRAVQSGEFPRPREATPWLDPALEAVCLRAMATRPEGRYATPLGLAEDVERWIADEPVSAYREPWSRRARRWRRRHRTAVTTATVAVVLLGVGGALFLAQRLRTDAAGLAALGEAGRRAEEARSTSDPAKWSEAIAEARRAEALLDSGIGGRSLRALARDRLAAYQDALRAEERDRRMIRDLDEARLLGANVKDEKYDARGMEMALREAFRSYGIDVAALPPGEAAARVRASRIRGPLIEALDEWAASGSANPPPGRLIAIARAADDAPGNAEVHDLIGRRDVAGIRRLVSRWGPPGGVEAGARPSVRALAFISPAACLPLLEARRREAPSDFWYNNTLANAYLRGSPPDLAKAARYYTAAVALRPTSPGARMKLGEVFHYMGDLVGAEVEHREAIRIRPGVAEAHNNLGVVLAARRRPAEAEAEYREALRIRPDLAEARYNLGTMLRERGRLVEAEAEFREADPPQARLCRRPHQPRLRPGGPGEARRGGGRAPRGRPDQARRRVGPRRPRQPPPRPGQARRRGGRVPRSDPAQARGRDLPL